jgi:hypothetical protein
MKAVILAGGLGMHLSEETSKVFFEQEPMKRLKEEGQLSEHFHHGFWQGSLGNLVAAMPDFACGWMPDV